MLKPPSWVAPERNWKQSKKDPRWWVVPFTCACGTSSKSRMKYGPKREQQLAELACWRCRRREWNRLYQRKFRGSDIAHEDRSCPQCGSIFTPERITARYCSARCRVAAHRAKQ
jgi:hypothetical protein